MSYSPINVQAYTAAYSGAISGMAISGWITDDNREHYNLVTQIAGAFAQAFDVAWGNAAALNNLELKSITAIVSADFSVRAPSPLENPNYQESINWSQSARACAAVVLQSDNYFAGQGINPGTSGGGGGLPLVASFFGEVPDMSAEPALNGLFYTAVSPGWFVLSGVLQTINPFVTGVSSGGVDVFIGPPGLANELESLRVQPPFSMYQGGEGTQPMLECHQANVYLKAGQTLELRSAGFNMIVGLRLEQVL